jgi:nucleoside 2-deoxyribosyltransferase
MVTTKNSIYLIGSLKNPNIPQIANEIEALGFEVFDDWFSPGPEADDFWRKYEKARGRTYAQALKGYAGKHIFEFDKTHIDRCEIGIMCMPAGKSGHLELGYMLGQGKRGYILFDKEPERWDVMYQFATGIFFDMKDLIKELKNYLEEPLDF